LTVARSGAGIIVGGPLHAHASEHRSLIEGDDASREQGWRPESAAAIRSKNRFW